MITEIAKHAIIIVMLSLIAIIDFKHKEIPTLATTSLIFFSLFITGITGVFSGLLALILALLLLEQDYFGGMADLKVMVAIGILTPVYLRFSIFVVIMLSYGIVWKALNKYYLKETKECAFTPVFLMVYLTLLISGLI